MSTTTTGSPRIKRIALTGLFGAMSLLPGLAQAARPSIYIEPQNGFETYVAAAIAKKQVPVNIVTDLSKATFELRAAPVEIKQESVGGKIARCLFAYCAGIEDKGNVSVQLIETSSSRILWAYSVNKQRGGSKNQQSMAEAVAKHFKEFLAKDFLAVVAAPALVPVPPAVDLSPAPAGIGVPTPTMPVAYRKDSAKIEPTVQARQMTVQEQESVANAARRTKQYRACVELSKDNPSILCK